MEHKIIAVGIGPGSKDYILPAAVRAIEKARIMVGSARALQDYQTVNTELTRKIDGNINGVLDFIGEQLLNDDVVVLLSGDPGYYSMLPALKKRFTDVEMTVIPGISSVQLAFARLALPWQEAELVSLHGREPDEARLCYKPDRKLGLLTDAIYNSQSIAALLLRLGWPESAAVSICSRLSYPDEKILTVPLGEAVRGEKTTHCIMVVIE